jgi:hypothetical protein
MTGPKRTTTTTCPKREAREGEAMTAIEMIVIEMTAIIMFETAPKRRFGARILAVEAEASPAFQD